MLLGFVFIVMIILLVIILIIEKKISVATTCVLMWLMLSGIGVIYYRNLNMPLKGIIYILFCCILFYLGTKMFGKQGENYENENMFLDSRKADSFFYISIVLEIMLIIISIKRYGYSFSNFLATSSIVRFTDYGERTLFSQWAVPFILATISVDGYLLSYSLSVEQKHRLRIIPLLAGLAINSMLSTGKSLLIWGAIFWLAGLLCGNHVFMKSKQQKKILFKFFSKHKKQIIFCSVLLVSLLMLMLFLRNPNAKYSLLNIIMNYGFGEIPCFSLWFEDIRTEDLQYSMGRQQIYGLLEQFNLASDLSFNWLLNDKLSQMGVFSNIYTVFRGIIEDFGIIGSFVFWIIFGVVVGIIERGSRLFKKQCFFETMLFAAYIFILFSFIISAYHYLSVMAAIFIFYLELVFLKKIKRKKIKFIFGKNENFS